MSFETLTAACDSVRVTSYMTRDRSTLIKGVPVLSDQQLKSARYSIQIWAKTESLPVQPAPGQVWGVAGDMAVRTVEVGDRLQDIHHYNEPKALNFTLPNDGESFIQFIARDPAFKGIGDSKARELWSEFKGDIHEVLQDPTGKHLPELRKVLTDKSIKSLYAGYAKYENLKHTLWMSKSGVPGSIQRRVLKFHKQGTVEAIKNDPYELVHFGLPLAGVDQLLKLPETPWIRCTEQRIAAAAKQGLQLCLKNGSTYATSQQVSNKVFNLLRNFEQTAQAVELLKTSPGLAVYHQAEDRLHPVSTAVQELAVAKRFKYLASQVREFTKSDQNALDGVLEQLPHDLTEKQLAGVKACLVNQIACLTGGAGTGKTFTCNAFLQTAIQQGYEVHAVALSGRAAMRLHESIGLVTRTIARFLRDEPVVCSKGQKKLLLIDEASMVDLPTMFTVINHISPEVKIIFTGDPNQLPPIGVGKILHDLISSGLVANTTLDIVKRQKGDTGIPQYSDSIKNGVVPEQLSTGNIYFYECSKDQVESTALSLYGFDPSSTRIVASTRKTTTSLNEAIQERFNGESELLNFNLNAEDFYTRFRLNDQVLFTRNHNQVGLQNGTLGKLVDVRQTEDRLGLVRIDTGELIELTQGLLDSIDLGYCITLHKGQGSQFPKVIVILEENRITDRSWLYTAVTRAESEVHIIGAENVFRKVTEAEPKAFKRKTLLGHLMAYLD
ncbi:MAG: ATP-dependent RecD-like DNA helicase [Motiliproteus sp.]|nr:ATP-dependent RecD-like DNA helicase [Motiliproteus sp.]MCW9050967.1 ATP-dependent RecD-like DNA helicase [Motiliproteus sp.]